MGALRAPGHEDTLGDAPGGHVPSQCPKKGFCPPAAPAPPGTSGRPPCVHGLDALQPASPSRSRRGQKSPHKLTTHTLTEHQSRDFTSLHEFCRAGLPVAKPGVALSPFPESPHKGSWLVGLGDWRGLLKGTSQSPELTDPSRSRVLTAPEAAASSVGRDKG